MVCKYLQKSNSHSIAFNTSFGAGNMWKTNSLSLYCRSSVLVFPWQLFLIADHQFSLAPPRPRPVLLFLSMFVIGIFVWNCLNTFAYEFAGKQFRIECQPWLWKVCAQQGCPSLLHIFWYFRTHFDDEIKHVKGVEFSRMPESRFRQLKIK